MFTRKLWKLAINERKTEQTKHGLKLGVKGQQNNSSRCYTSIIHGYPIAHFGLSGENKTLLS